MSRVIAVVNQKGGVGKTTTAVNLGACLAGLGRRVLLVDMDPQGNASTGLGVDKQALSISVYDCLRDGRPLTDAIVATAIEGLWVAPATVDLAGAEVELASELARETRLRACVDPVAEDYDYVLLDSPPSLGLLTVNCLTAAGSVLVPIQCEYYALEGLKQLRDTLHLVRTMLNPALEMLGVVLTMFDARTNLAREVAEEVTAHFPGRVYKSVIPRNVRLAEAPSHGLPAVAYDRTSTGARAYQSLYEEVFGHAET